MNFLNRSALVRVANPDEERAMLRSFLCAMVLMGTAASAQVTNYKASDGTSAINPDKIVCQKEEQIGSRLGGKKTCLTVREWEARKQADRLQTEEVQAGARMRDSADPPGMPTPGPH
jgi:hypothetical protein